MMTDPLFVAAPDTPEVQRLYLSLAGIMVKIQQLPAITPAEYALLASAARDIPEILERGPIRSGVAKCPRHQPEQ